MPKIIPLAVAAATLAALTLSVAPPATASVARSSVLCAKTAHVVSGDVYDLSKGAYDPANGLTLPPTSVSKLYRNVMFVATSPAELSFGGFAYLLSADTIVSLSCSGGSAATAVDPMLIVKMGSVSVQTGGSDTKGTISSGEMLLDPYANRRMTFSLTRTPKDDPTLTDVLKNGPGTLQFGTAKAVRTGGHGYINVTPYIGKERRTNGLCHQSRGALIVSSSLHGGYLTGSVDYTKLARFSPR
jgi:hypothetical protein